MSSIHRTKTRVKRKLDRMDTTITDLTKVRNDVYRFLATQVRPGKINHCNGPMVSDLFLDSPLTGLMALRLHRGYMILHQTLGQLEEMRRDALHAEHSAERKEEDA